MNRINTVLTLISSHFSGPFHDLTEIETKMNSTFNQLWSFAKNIITPIAIACMGICGIMIVISSDAQSVKNAKGWMLRIAAGLFVVYGAKLIVDTIVAIVG